MLHFLSVKILIFPKLYQIGYEIYKTIFYYTIKGIIINEFENAQKLTPLKRK